MMIESAVESRNVIMLAFDTNVSGSGISVEESGEAGSAVPAVASPLGFTKAAGKDLWAWPHASLMEDHGDGPREDEDEEDDRDDEEEEEEEFDEDDDEDEDQQDDEDDDDNEIDEDKGY